MARIFAALVVLAAVLALPAGAPAIAEETAGGMAGAVATRPAIGRLNHAGYSRRRHCTMVAVAPETVLTASHCLEGLPASAFHLLFGYARMTWQAERTATAAHPVAGDLSALCLAEPVATARAIGPPPAVGDAVVWVGYGRPRVHLQEARTCIVARRGGGEIALDCPAPRGASGGPVLDGAGRVVAILSRTGRSTSIATLVPADVAERCH
ncbi:MAG: hypothetical protein AcusKO_13200 [Acuticoccus sp.]